MDRDEDIIIKELKKFRDCLNKIIHVEKLIFFGSRVTGTFHKDSDIDLIVVSEDFKGKKFRERPVGFYRIWTVDYPVDFLCYSFEEFNILKNEASIVREAVKEGIEI